MEPTKHTLKIRLGPDGLGSVELDGRPIRTSFISFGSVPGNAAVARLDVLVDDLDVDVESDRIEVRKHAPD